MREYKSGIVIRGKYIEDNFISFQGRYGEADFLCPDPRKYIDEIPLKSPYKLADLYSISFDEILDYLDSLSDALEFDKNVYLQQAYDIACQAAAGTPSLIMSQYQSVSQVFKKGLVKEVAEKRLGLDCIEGWRSTRLRDGRILNIRAFGARGLHIIAGNSPSIAAMTIMRNAITRSDAIIKCPSNDPFSALAIARTMIDMAPDHPLTKHLSVAYWKGGDEEIESALYQPRNIEKLVAWGGFASVKHVTKYIQPGLELITLDPKRSATIIGPEVFSDIDTQKKVALRLATDIGAFNQEGCVNARVVYVLSGTDDKNVEKLNRFGNMVYEALISLPEMISTKPKLKDQELSSHIRATRLADEWYKVIGGEEDEGAIIVSQIPEPVEYATLLCNRVANIVPVDSLDDVFNAVDSYTQTIGVYPESLKLELRDKLPLFGAQRLTSLGYAAVPSLAGPWDAIEPVRRMCKWIVEEECDPDFVSPLWETGLIINGS